jgi:Trypsin-like peptidase domain
MSIIAKLVYSALLLGLSGILLRELWTVWFDTTIYIGRFDVISDTGKDDSASAIFPKRIVGAQAILAQQFNDYQTRRAADAPSDATYILPGMTPLLLPPEVLAGVDITVQNVNLRQVLTAVRKRAAHLRAHYSADAVFPELYRLRADLLDLLPEGELRQGELVEAQEDRLRYAMLSPKLRGLPDEEKRLAALALARPAILIEDRGLSGEPENWATLLRRHDTEIRSAATSVGLIVRGDGTPVATGFVVAPGLTMTADYVLPEARRGPLATEGKRPTDRLRLCLGPSKSSCSPSMTIGDIAYVGEAEGSRIALANLVAHDIVLHPPLPLAEPLPATNTLIGQYAFVIGYPFRDPRVPARFTELLLGKEDGCKRLMPGRILAFGQGGRTGFVGLESGHPAPAVFTTDISTSAGTGGAPLVDLTTGRAIGMSFAGQWKGECGKFAYAESIPKGALDVIGRRLHGEPDQPKGPTRGGASPKGESPAE